MATETFANVPSTTVSSGGTNAPVSGTVETWTVASSTSFPAAATGVTQFHVADPLEPTEVIAVTNISGTTWTVTRGAESSTPVAHLAGFTVVQVVSAGALGTFVQNPMTASGDTVYGAASGTPARLAGNTSATKNFYTQTGSGAASAAPAWGTIAAADMPAGTTSAQGALQLDGTAGDIQPAGQTAAAGTKGQAADAKHIHPPGSSFLCTPSSYAPASQTLLTVGSTTMAVPGITTTVASGSNGGEISAVASWATPSNGVLDVASTTGFASTGTLLVVASGPTVAVVTYTGTSGGTSFTGCAYVSGSASGTVATGGFVSQASASALVSTGSFTAPVSQDVLVTAVLATETSTSSTATAYGLAVHGTLTPLVAPIVNVKAPSAALVMMITVQFLVTGLTNGSTYNYDLLMCVASPSTASIAAAGVTSTSPSLGNTGVSAPALMTVQAV